MKILILRFSSIGDIVLTTPVVRCVKHQVKNCELHYATKSRFASLLQTNPYIDKLHLLDNSIFDLITQLRKEKFDYIIDLHHNLRTAIIKNLLGVKSFSFDKLNFEKWLLVNLKINRMPDTHIVERYLKTIEKLGVINDKGGLDFFLTNEEDEFGKSIATKKKYVAFAIGGQKATKKMPPEKIVELINTISLASITDGRSEAKPILLLGGKEDETAANFILSKTKGVENFCGKISIQQSAAIIKYADIVLTHDTGMMHIASAFQKKIISIWGNTIPQFGMQPYLPKELFFNAEVENLNCRPCSKIGYNSCPKGHFKCMSQQNILKITKAMDIL